MRKLDWFSTSLGIDRSRIIAELDEGSIGYSKWPDRAEIQVASDFFKI
jgi:hypothetical protein